MSTTIEAFALIPHGGPAIAIAVACIFSAVIAAIVAMEADRAPALWAAGAFAATLVLLSVLVDLVTG